MHTERALAHNATLFAALGDVTRLSIVQRLADGLSYTATQLSDGAAVSRQAITKHLRVLEDAGLVRRGEDGRAVLYAIDVERLDEARAFLEGVSAGWERAIDRLRRLVEDGGR